MLISCWRVNDDHHSGLGGNKPEFVSLSEVLSPCEQDVAVDITLIAVPFKNFDLDIYQLDANHMPAVGFGLCVPESGVCNTLRR